MYAIILFRQFMSRLTNSLTTHWNMAKMLFVVYEALCQKPKEITLTQQRQPIALHSKHTVLSFAVWHLRNGLIHGASKRKITYEDRNSPVHVSVAAAALSVLLKQRPFLYETFLVLSAQAGNDWIKWKIHRIREPEPAWKLRRRPGALPKPSPWQRSYGFWVML